MAEGSEQIRLSPRRASLDLATIAGLGGGLALVALAIAFGSSFAAFFDPSALAVVVGGTLAVTTVSFTLPDMARTVRIIGKTLVHSRRDPAVAATRLLQLSEAARHNGLLTLQNAVHELHHDPFLQNAVTLALDGTPPAEVDAILKRELQAMVARHDKAAGILRRAAEVSPAMGLIGTLIGLVQMLGNLDDPSTIGPGMALALLTTFYGAVLSNMVFLPLATKLEANSVEETLINQLSIMGVVSICRQENPRRLEMLLNSILPPAKRLRYFD